MPLDEFNECRWGYFHHLPKITGEVGWLFVMESVGRLFDRVADAEQLESVECPVPSQPMLGRHTGIA